MKEKLKKNWHIIVIIVLVLFSLSKCTQSCNRQFECDTLNHTIEQKDSMLNVYNDSIITLNHKIDILMNDNENQEKLVETQKDAINKINEAKKNINVTVKKR